MKVLLATAYPTPWSYLPQFRRLAEQDRFKVHTLTEDPEEADIILFVDARHEHGDWRFRALRDHPFSRRYPGKCFVYNEMDQPWCCMPGLYVSMPRRWFDRSRMRACSYLGLMNPYLLEEADRATAEGRQPDLLFGFSGRRCAAVREQVLRLQHPRGLIEDTSAFNFFGDPGRPAEEIEAQRRQYARTLLRSKFVLCPRGSGPASFRLFEALAVGRVPVILSDEWVPIDGPDWGACSVRLPESRVAEVPAVLEGLESDGCWPQMSRAALAAWTENFAGDVLFHRMADGCFAIANSRRVPERLRRRMTDGRSIRLYARAAKARLRVLCSQPRRRRPT